MTADARERVGARSARALDLDTVARLEPRDVEAGRHRAVDAGDGDDVAVDRQVAVDLDRLRLRGLTAAGHQHDGVAARGAAAELAVREAAARLPAGGQVGAEPAPPGRAAALCEAGDVRAAGDDA